MDKQKAISLLRRIQDPEPYEPYHYCEKCSEELYQKWLKGFKQGSRSGYWQKSNAEVRAAKEMGLTWIHSEGYPKTEKDSLKRKYYEYVEIK